MTESCNSWMTKCWLIKLDAITTCTKLAGIKLFAIAITVMCKLFVIATSVKMIAIATSVNVKMIVIATMCKLGAIVVVFTRVENPLRSDVP